MTATEAVKKIVALRELEAATGTHTSRVQTRILRSLNDADLLAAAVELKRIAELNAASASLFGDKVGGTNEHASK